jgi:hypothetical protein
VGEVDNGRGDGPERLPPIPIADKQEATTS